jgi:pimeloyl-ACP methyl ester carboxylesterase
MSVPRHRHPMTTRTIAGPAGTLNVDDGGSGGVPVVLLHGFGGNTSHWAAQLDHLRRTRRAIAIDLRGHGRSAAPADGDYAVESQVDDLSAVLDDTNIARAVLVGHSLGGAIALAFASRHPTRVGGLVLASAPGRVPEEQSRQVVGAMEADYEGTSAGYWERLTAGAAPDVVDQLRRERANLDSTAGLAIIKATFAFDPLSALQAYHGPRLAITTPHAGAPHELHNLDPDLPHRVMTGTSHFLQMDRPDDFNEILDEFLAIVDPAEVTPTGRAR